MSAPATMEDDVFTGKVDLALWRKVIRFALPHRSKIGAVMLLGGLVAAFDMALPFLTGRIVDAIGREGTSLSLRGYVAAYAVLVVIFSAGIFGFIMMAGRITTDVSYDIRQACFDQLQRLPFAYYDRRAVGWLMARMTGDCSTLSRVMAWSVLDLTWGSCSVLGAVGLMAYLSWRLAAIVVAMAPVLVLVSRYYQVRLLKTSRDLRKANSQTTAAYNEGIVGVRTSKSLVREDRNAEEFGGLTQTMYGHAVRNAIYSSLFWPMMLSVCGVGTALALRFGGLGVLHGQLTLGALATFLQVVFFIQFPIQELTNAITQIQGAQASAERVQGLLDAPAEIEDSPAVLEAVRRHNRPATADTAVDGGDARIRTIEFRDVSFSYAGGGRTVLTDFNLTVRAGESIALVGPTGGGKTTIVGLACRFYEPTAGQILVNGVDYRERPLGWLQSTLGMVLQQPHLFSGTVRENIRYGRLTATDDDVTAAAKLAGADAFITTLTGGYDAKVGEGGNQLSTGQKQLVALARAIIADPQVFVMDEATSSVDTQTERAIQSAVDRILRDRISFVIAHRLSTIRSAGRILVVEAGRIVEDGSHAQLVRRRGHYHELYTNQFAHERAAAVLGGGAVAAFG